MAKKASKKKPRMSHMGLGSEEELGLPYVKEWPFWWMVAAGIAVCILVAVILGWLTPAHAGESNAVMTCTDGTEDEFTQLAGDEYQPLERVAIDRLITFLVWTGRPAAKAEHAWRGAEDGNVVVVFARWPCIVGFVTMDEPTFTAVVEAKPLPKPPLPQAEPTDSTSS